ncbi:hypothetical protein PLICRDRAFT_113796 [Plicaturopsis crispa FD-325 SS-3]|nr:hypothetical protein PLICRDRAFT_113796 [Plicaturopsis crispa FD-325 SS-3]
MSLARQLFHEFRPLVGMFDEPLLARRAVSPAGFFGPARSLLEHPFFDSFQSTGIDMSEDASNYIVEAEVPGVKKENLNISVGDAGRSLTIEGRVFRRNRQALDAPQATPAVEGASDGAAAPTPAPATAPPAEQQSTYSSSFTRTVWLPRPVVPSSIHAKLSDGILTVRIPKAEPTADNVRVDIE